MKTLPGIYLVEFLLADELVLYPKKIITPGDTISAIGNWTDLGQRLLSSCSVDTEQTENGIIYNTKVSGDIWDRDEADLLHRLATVFHVYRITDVYRQKYLIGTDKIPFPEIVFNHQNDAMPDGTRTINFEISWKSTIPPTPLILL